MVLWSQGVPASLCTASVVENVPRWLYRSGRGGSPPSTRCSRPRPASGTDREAASRAWAGAPSRSNADRGAVRGVIDFEALGERTVHLDRDVLQADGGTRCAAICGAYVALTCALDRFGLAKAISGSVAAVSSSVVDGEPLLDLEYTEDSTADVDLNVVMTGEASSSRCRRPPSACRSTACDSTSCSTSPPAIEEPRAPSNETRPTSPRLTRA